MSPSLIRYSKSFISTCLIFLSCACLFACSAKTPHSPTSAVATTASTSKSIKAKPQKVLVERSPNPQASLARKALSAHNRIRSKHGLTPLRWSKQLAAYSQQWANHLGRGNSCGIAHRRGSSPYGENLFRSSAIVWTSDNKETAREKNPLTVQAVIASWTNEERWYDYQRNRCTRGKQCYHYTQVVWRQTKEVGCAVKVCKDLSQVWVCNYNPPGNYVGQRPY